MFLEAPKDALTVKVGPGDTAARLGTLHCLRVGGASFISSVVYCSASLSAVLSQV